MRWLLALLLVGTLAGCRTTTPTGTGTVPVGSSTQTLTVDGRTRTVHLYRPANLPDKAPLVLFLHGGFGSGDQAERYYGWDARADAEHFVVAYPDGVNHAWAVGGGCCGTPGSTGVDDVAFLVQVVTAVSRQLPVDPDRVYATGISNGGLMAYRLACDTTVFAAIGPDSATLLGPCPTPAPLSVIHIHGTADHNIPYEGGRGDGYAHIDGPAVPALMGIWRAVDGCPSPTVTIVTVVTTALANCPHGRAVELITIAGAGHQWPGSPDHPGLQRLLGTDPPSPAVDATLEIWRFFVAHPRQR